MLGQRKHHINVSYYNCNHLNILHHTTGQGHPAGERWSQGQNPGLSESCCPPTFPYTTLLPTSQRVRVILLQSWVSSLSDCVLIPHRQGPCLTHVYPSQPQTHMHRRSFEMRQRTPCQEVWRSCGQHRRAGAPLARGLLPPSGWNVPCWRLRIRSGPDPLQGSLSDCLAGTLGRQTRTHQL